MAASRAPDVTPWLPVGATDRNVEQQRPDPTSMLALARDLIALRKRTPDLSVGTYTPLPAPDGAWVWKRGDRHAVAVNLSDAGVTIDSVSGRVLDRHRPVP